MIPRWIEPITLDDAVRAYVTGRGDVADSPYSGFNICHYTGDSPERVKECRDRLAGFLGLPVGSIIVPRQTHSNNCLILDSMPVGSNELEGVDAIVTRLKGVAIGVSTADCVPVVMDEPEAGIIGVAHAGWRGAVGGIIGNTIRAMERLGANPSEIRVAMGPCICKDCFEVGEEVALQFPDDCVSREYEKPHVDLPGYVRKMLIECGVAPENIKLPEDCTRCSPDRYFSARYMGINSGRNFTFIVR